MKSIESALDSMHDTLYELIRDNRENQAQKVRLVVIECFSKQEQIHNNKALHDPVTGITHKKGTLLIPTDREIEKDKYHYSNILTLEPRVHIKKLLNNLFAMLIQNCEDNSAKIKGDSSHKLKYIKQFIIKFHEINQPNARSHIPTPPKLYAKKAIINPENHKDNKCFIHAIVISLYHDELKKYCASRVTTKKFKECTNRWNTDNVRCPRTIEDINHFEKDNPDIAVTIFEYDGFHEQGRIKIND